MTQPGLFSRTVHPRPVLQFHVYHKIYLMIVILDGLGAHLQYFACRCVQSCSYFNNGIAFSNVQSIKSLCFFKWSDFNMLGTTKQFG